MGANAYITKPVTFEKLVEAMEHLQEVWFGLCGFPERWPNCGALAFSSAFGRRGLL